MKLFPKLALIISGLLISVSATLGLSFYLLERHNVREQVNLEQQALLQNLVHIAQESFLSNDDLLLVKYTSWLQKWNPSLVSASVVLPSGEVIAHSEPSEIGQYNPKSVAAHALILQAPVRLGAHQLATATIAFSEASFEQTVHERLVQLQKRIAQFTSVALGLGLLISLLLTLSWTRPIAQLASAASLIGQGKWAIQLGTLERRRDELGFLGRSFRSMAEQLRELDMMKEDFVSAVTHELRSPLGAIESYLNLIATELAEGISLETWEMYLQRLRLNTQRLTRFVNDLLDVAAIERGKIHLERQAVDLNNVAQDVISLFVPKFQEKQLTCELLDAKDLPKAYADADKLRQVLINLVSNAIKFTPAGGHLTIRVENMTPRKQLRVAVSDTGLGISEADQLKIFNKFEQVRSARQAVKGPKGTGLGLAISRALVELHGGSIGVHSQVGAGSTFFFTVPIAETPVAAAGIV